MKWIDAIKNRTQADVTNRMTKGFFNISDWTRIYNNSQIANQIVVLLWKRAVQFLTLTTPTSTTIPSVDNINHLVENIETARIASGLPNLLIGPIKHDYLSGSNAITPTYEDVNSWESSLDIIRDATARAAEYSMFCGVPRLGQMRFWQSQFRQFPGFAQPVANPVRHARSNISNCGSGILRQNGFRRYV